ncbi:striatin-3-like isoform X4 [Ornithodoros turicata]|uniref:striatin-3-like isoform X4 n=1 Tax=Ornithodoros turicata TaxID=34597 RepID=UPI003138933B
MMDEGPSTQNHTGQLGPPSGSLGVGGKMTQEDQNQRPQYSIPGILHFIQHEWARFEMERAQWDVERAELQARIAFLQGERKGQENLKNDLIRRIKMLEFALKQERVKLHKLKYEADPNPAELKAPVFDDMSKDEPMDGETLITSNSNVSWKQGRQLLRQYLQEIGYTDTILDVRSARVRTLLGLSGGNAGGALDDKQHHVTVNGGGTAGEQQLKRPSDTQRRVPGKKMPNVAENTLLDAEASVLATFDFLSTENVDMEDEDENFSDEMEDATSADDEAEERMDSRRIKSKTMGSGDELGEADTENVLTEFDYLGPDSGEGSREVRNQGDGSNWGSRRPLMGGPGVDEDNIDAALGLGELAGLTVNNEAESGYDISATKESFRKTWNAKYTLRSHFDSVRALAFHPVEPVLITASEDHTLKLWNLQKTVPAKKTTALDVEPVYTFRGHVGPVLCLAMSATGEQCFSGGLDHTIRCWNVPSSTIDPYDAFEPGVLSATLKGHTDAVWSLSMHAAKLQLLSCAGDATVRLWAPLSKVPLLHTYTSESSDGIPTSVDFVRSDPTQMTVAYTSSHCVLFDLETGKPVLRLDSDQNPDASALSKQINCVVSHPTLPLTVTAHEDRHIRFFDNNTGKMVHSMVAHLDAVTSLAIDPNGLYLLSGSHDCSIRLWNLDNKTCVQEITSHRKKFDEAIFDVAFHPSKPYIASAGADALAKVFV